MTRARKTRQLEFAQLGHSVTTHGQEEGARNAFAQLAGSFFQSRHHSLEMVPPSFRMGLLN